MELLLPVLLRIFPGFLPSTFQSPSKKEAVLERQMAVRLEIAEMMQETLTGLAQKQVEARSSKQKKREQQQKEEDEAATADAAATASATDPCAASQLLSLLSEVRAGRRHVSTDEIARLSELFRSSITLERMSRKQLVRLSRFFGLNLLPYASDSLMRMALTRKIESLRRDDHFLAQQLPSLKLNELRQACHERGIRSIGLTEQGYRRQLQSWLDLSLKHRVPDSLLLLSRPIGLLEQRPSRAHLRDALLRFDEDVLAEIVPAAAEEDAGEFDAEERLRMLRAENKRILEEQEEEKRMQKEQEEREKQEAAAKQHEPAVAAAAEPAGAAASSVPAAPSASLASLSARLLELVYADMARLSEMRSKAQRLKRERAERKAAEEAQERQRQQEEKEKEEKEHEQQRQHQENAPVASAQAEPGATSSQTSPVKPVASVAPTPTASPPEESPAAAAAASDATKAEEEDEDDESSGETFSSKLLSSFLNSKVERLLQDIDKQLAEAERDESADETQNKKDGEQPSATVSASSGDASNGTDTVLLRWIRRTLRAQTGNEVSESDAQRILATLRAMVQQDGFSISAKTMRALTRLARKEDDEKEARRKEKEKDAREEDELKKQQEEEASSGGKKPAAETDAKSSKP